MTTVVLDKDLREKMKDLDHEVLFCDESGRKIGRFLPEAEYMRLLYDQARNMFTDEEIERARRQPGGFTTAEVLEHLSKLS